ncbi:hypothetical protein C922_05337, partial [Plasmodium inui San Antonio 1]
MPAPRVKWELDSLATDGVAEGVENVYTTNCGGGDRTGKFCLKHAIGRREGAMLGLNNWTGDLNDNNKGGWGKFQKLVDTRSTGLKSGTNSGKQSVTWSDLLTCIMNKLMEVAKHSEANKENNEVTFWTRDHWAGYLNKNQDAGWNDNNNTQIALMMIVCILLGFRRQTRRGRGEWDPKQYDKVCAKYNEKLEVKADDWQRFYQTDQWKWDYQKRQCNTSNNREKCSGAAFSLLLSVYMAMRKCCPDCHSYDLSGWLRRGPESIPEAKQWIYEEKRKLWTPKSEGSGRLSIGGDDMGRYLMASQSPSNNQIKEAGKAPRRPNTGARKSPESPTSQHPPPPPPAEPQESEAVLMQPPEPATTTQAPDLGHTTGKTDAAPQPQQRQEDTLPKAEESKPQAPSTQHVEQISAERSHHMKDTPERGAGELQVNRPTPESQAPQNKKDTNTPGATQPGEHQSSGESDNGAK